MTLMKNGAEAPEKLSEALDNDAYALKVFLKMRPSCQIRYAERVLGAKTEEAMCKRVDSAIKQIYSYGQRHSIALPHNSEGN